MPLVKCEFCCERVSKPQLKLHQKYCINYRRHLKRSGFVKIEESVSAPSDLVLVDESIDRKKKKKAV